MIASKSARFFALLLDRLVMYFLFILASLFSESKNGETVDLSLDSTLLIIMGVLYFLLADSFLNGQSIGKKVLGIVVVSTNSGRNCSVLQSFIRNVFYLVPLSGLIEICSVLFNEDRRRVGDKLAGTIVIKEGSRW